MTLKNQTDIYLEIVPQNSSTRYVALREFDEQMIIIGRSKRNCDIVLADSRISRVHLRLTLTEDDQVLIADLHSANGTLLEGRALPPNHDFVWQVSQMITLGATRLFLWRNAVADLKLPHPKDAVVQSSDDEGKTNN